MLNFQFRAEVKKVTSRAKLKSLQLEPARLGLITSNWFIVIKLLVEYPTILIQAQVEYSYELTNTHNITKDLLIAALSHLYNGVPERPKNLQGQKNRQLPHNLIVQIKKWIAKCDQIIHMYPLTM